MPNPKNFNSHEDFVQQTFYIPSTLVFASAILISCFCLFMYFCWIGNKEPELPSFATDLAISRQQSCDPNMTNDRIQNNLQTNYHPFLPRCPSHALSQRCASSNSLQLISLSPRLNSDNLNLRRSSSLRNTRKYMNNHGMSRITGNSTPCHVKPLPISISSRPQLPHEVFDDHRRTYPDQQGLKRENKNASVDKERKSFY